MMRWLHSASKQLIYYTNYATSYVAALQIYRAMVKLQ